jgi:hypothetical protein
MSCSYLLLLVMRFASPILRRGESGQARVGICGLPNCIVHYSPAVLYNSGGEEHTVTDTDHTTGAGLCNSGGEEHTVTDTDHTTGAGLYKSDGE